MPGPDRQSEPVRINNVVRILLDGPWSGLYSSSPWSGFFGADVLVTVRGRDFLVRIFTSPVRGPDNPYRSGFFCGPVHVPIFLKMFGPGGHGSEYILYVSKEDFRLYVFELLYIQSLKAKEISSEVSRIKTAFYKLMIGYSNSNTPTLVKLVPLALLFIPIK